MDLGDYLLQYKTEQNIGNQKLSEALGISKLTLLRILRKEVVPNARTCMKIAKVMGISFNQVMNMRSYSTDEP